jgi:hypothetical protein
VGIQLGIIPNGQFHIVAPIAFDSPSREPTQFGYGDTDLGFKYRFIQEDKNGSTPMVGVYPHIELPTGSQAEGLGAGPRPRISPDMGAEGFGKRLADLLAAAAIGSITAAPRSIRITGSSAGCCKGR